MSKKILKKYNVIVDRKPYCQICGSDENLCDDHCHETGFYRGTLCRTHNLGLGQFQDDCHTLRAAIKYLLEAKKKFEYFSGDYAQ